MDSNPICHPSPAKKMKCSFLDYVQLWMISWAGQWTWTPSASPLQLIKWNATFWITSTSDDRLDYVLVNGLKPHPPPLSSQKNEMLIFGLLFTSDDLPGWLMNLNPIHHPSPTKKMICSFFKYIQPLMISQAGRWTRTPSATPLLPKNEMLIFGLRSTSDDQPAGRWPQSPSATPLQPIKWNAHFQLRLHSTSDYQPG